MPPPREVVLTPQLLDALEDLLDRRERRAAAYTACPIESNRTEDGTSRPQAIPMHAPGPSAATQGTRATMTQPSDIMTQEEIEELVARTFKEQKGRVMPRLKDRASYPFIREILDVMVRPHIQNPRFDCDRGEGDPVDHIQRHENSLPGRTSDDNHFALLFS